MLVQEQSDSQSPAPVTHRTPANLATLTFVAIVVIVLRHDYWNWDTPYPLLFGFLPVGLWWQGLVSLLASGMMWLMVRFAWPGELENEVQQKDERVEDHP